MTNPPRLTNIFDEAVKAAQTGRAELATAILCLLPPRESLMASARNLLGEIENTFGIHADKNSRDSACVDFMTGGERENSFEWPTISVVTPSYNQGEYIRETIQSVIGQGYPNLEYIIIDGGSTDGTVPIIEEYQDRISHWVSEKDRGQSHAINKGFEVATGEILTWLNSDDQFAEDALFHMALGFMTSGADMVAGICELHESGVLNRRHLTSCSDGAIRMEEILDLEKGWKSAQFFYQPEVFFRRSLWEKAGAHVREDCFYSMDYELWCRFAAVGAKLHVIGVPIVDFRLHPAQKTADPSKYRTELLDVRKRFVDEWLKDGVAELGRPEINWSKKIHVAMINDHGFKYGAGIAHQRIAACLKMAGFIVHEIAVSDFSPGKTGYRQTVSKIMDRLSELSPDIVIFGNLHGQWKEKADIVHEVQEKYTAYWLVHDFWLFTGRCAYVVDCSKNLSGCDHLCPTADRYPSIPRDRINDAWKWKRRILEESGNLTILAYSDWAKTFSENYLASFENEVPVERITLGLPVDVFRKTDRAGAKKEFGIDPNSFTIAFSVSSLSEKRKGADFLEAALHLLPSEDITLLLMGYCDVEMDLPDMNVVRLGYVENSDVLVKALNAADIFVGPSSEETLGQVFLEAAACGLPSVGFAGSGVENAIVHDVTGILVRERSAVQLAAAISCLIRDPEYRARLARTAWLHARNAFSLEASFRSFFQVFKKQGLIDLWQRSHEISFKWHLDAGTANKAK